MIPSEPEPEGAHSLMAWVIRIAVVGVVAWMMYQSGWRILAPPGSAGGAGEMQALENEVRDLVQERLREAQAKARSPHLISVGRVVLVRESQAKYSGTATIRYRGAEYNIGIEVTADGRALVYRLDPVGLLAVYAQDLKD